MTNSLDLLQVIDYITSLVIDLTRHLVVSFLYSKNTAHVAFGDEEEGLIECAFQAQGTISLLITILIKDRFKEALSESDQSVGCLNCSKACLKQGHLPLNDDLL